MIVSVGVAYRNFFGSAVHESAIVYLSTTDLQTKGYEQVIDSAILPHMSHHKAFDIYAKRLNLPQKIRSGRYQLSEGQSVMDVVRILKLGIQEPIILKFNNIRTPGQLASRLSLQIEADSTIIMQALESPEILNKVGVKNREEMLAIFIPNSYEVYWNITPESLIQRMKTEHSRFWNETREQKRKELNLSQLEVSTLASIVYEETAREDEMARVAGVYVNRLKRGMKLQADPTVKYAMGDFELKRILHKHLKYDSPYNTYRYGGLPPTPIAMPSIAAIDAVLNYEKHKYLFFCARPEFDGYHNFAQTLVQHNANSRAYSAELNRRNIK